MVQQECMWRLWSAVAHLRPPRARNRSVVLAESASPTASASFRLTRLSPTDKASAERSSDWSIRFSRRTPDTAAAQPGIRSAVWSNRGSLLRSGRRRRERCSSTLLAVIACGKSAPKKCCGRLLPPHSVSGSSARSRTTRTASALSTPQQPPGARRPPAQQRPPFAPPSRRQSRHW